MRELSKVKSNGRDDDRDDNELLRDSGGVL